MSRPSECGCYLLWFVAWPFFHARFLHINSFGQTPAKDIRITARKIKTTISFNIFECFHLECDLTCGERKKNDCVRKLCRGSVHRSTGRVFCCNFDSVFWRKCDWFKSFGLWCYDFCLLIFHLNKWFICPVFFCNFRDIFWYFQRYYFDWFKTSLISSYFNKV